MRSPNRHPFLSWRPREREGLAIVDRRGMLKASMAGLAGLTLPRLLQARDAESANGNRKSVILLWMAGGPSHIDTWDPKPDRPYENRGPFGVTQTRIPGVAISEHLPKQAEMLDRFTLIRSVDCRGSNHEPNLVMQTGHRTAAPRINPKGDRFPSIGSVVGKHHGANAKGIPPYVAFMKSRSHLGFSGYLGKEHDPFIANNAADLPIYTNVGQDTGTTTGARMFELPNGLAPSRLTTRHSLVRQLDRLRGDLDQSGSMDALDYYQAMALEMIHGDRVREALDLQNEPASTRDLYGNHLWCQQALLARRLVQAGVSFVTLDLSYHSASGTWDTHGDNIPPYGGIRKGLGPLLPLFDHLITTLVTDLDRHDILDEVLVIAMGEFGRTPNLGTQGSTDGRDHWPFISSMALAGGGLRHGQVIGSSDNDGGQIKSRPVSPADLAATIYRHMSVPLDTTYLDHRGRPNYVVDGGVPIGELFG